MGREKPLSRGEVTQGSHVILPAYPILLLLVAGFLLFQSPTRTSGESWEIATLVLDIHIWGMIFALVGSLEVLGLCWHRRVMFIRLLVVGAALCGFWGTLFLVAAQQSENVSWTSGLWVWFVAVAHIASIRSLARDNIVRG